MEKELKTYLQDQFNRSVHKKYRLLFEQWFSNLTETQIMYFAAYMVGRKSPYTKNSSALFKKSK